jgi:predicted enzyme related to lactoylglutathione lyase
MANDKLKWMELTTEKTRKAADFYKNVFALDLEEVPTQRGKDYNMRLSSSSKPFAGICNPLVTEEDIYLPFWLPYFSVENLDNAITRVAENGGKTICDIQIIEDYGRYVVIKDNIGSVVAIFEEQK